MAETIVASPIVHEVLNSDNYEEWTIRLKTYLIAHNLWDVVEPNDEPSKEGQNVEANGETSEEGLSVTAKQGKSEEVNGETSEKGKSAEVDGAKQGQSVEANGEHSNDEQSVEANDEASKQIQSEVEIKKNATALHAIHISCGSDAFSVVKDIPSPKEAWKALKEKYKPIMVQYNSKGEPFKYQAFFEAVRNTKDDWSIVKDILKKHPEEEKDIVRSIHPGTKETGLHVAATAGNEKIVKELVDLMEKKDLEIKGTDGCTALTEAVLTGMTGIAKCMVEKNEKIVSMADDSDKLLPVVNALSYGYNDMADYLYSKTPKEVLSPEEYFDNAAALLYWSIDAKNYGIALDMLTRSPRLAITVHKDYGSPFCTLAENPAMFPSASGFNSWQRWIYNRIDVQNQHAAADDIYINVQNQEDNQTSRKNICCTGLLKWLASYISKLLGIEHIREMKFAHDRTNKILQIMCEVIKTLDDKELEECLVVDALHKATANGMIEFFVTLLKANPELLWLEDKNTEKNLFMVAVEHRQPKIFSLIYGLKSKQAIAAMRDSYDNNMLHMAGLLAPPSQLTSIAGPALQMQRELQWFKEVEKVISPSLKGLRNLDGETPQELFTKSHKDLMEKGEKWMKGTAQSCTVPVALIVTIMFAAILTVPGGLIQDTGRPLLSHDKMFKIFITMDATSLFSSVVSMIMFLEVLSSHYNEDDFLTSLPQKMMLGILTLFISIVTMMICFSAVLILVAAESSRVIVPTILTFSLPITIYLIPHLRLVFEIVKLFTDGSRIFERNQNRWL